jgi:ATP-binding cassette subfamily B protein
MSKDEKITKNKFDKSIWIKILSNMGPLWKYCIVAFLASVVLAIIDVGYPLLNQYAINHIIALNDRDSLFPYISLFVIFVILQLIFTFIFIKSAGKIQVELAYVLRKKAFDKLQKLSFSYFDKTSIGSIMSRMTSDSRNLSDILSWSLTEVLWGFLVMIGIGIVMFIVNWKLALIALSVVPILVYVSIHFRKKILKAYRKVREVNAKITAAVNESIVGAKTTKTLVIEEDNLEEYNAITLDMKHQSVRAAVFSGLYYPSIMFLSGIGTVFVLYFGGHMVAEDVILVGTLFLFISYMRQFFDPVMQLANLLARFQQAQASAERVMSLIEYEPDIVDTQEVIERYGDEFNLKKENWEEIKGKVEFRNVSFNYDEGSSILKDFNLTVEAGESIAIVGHTGAGKSTIVNIICRFYEPVKGSILIDDKDYRERSITWLHHQLGYVLQSPQLFSGTIMDNIGYGKEDATPEEIIEVAKYLGADEFISEFEKGYFTEVGEGGARLSVGQKQLISFARALLANPKILILDEATSSVDTGTEKAIQQGIDKIMKDRTSFVVAHRLSTIKNCNRILVLKDGEIVEQGSHDELIKNHDYYYQLFTNQFKNEVVEESLK